LGALLSADYTTPSSEDATEVSIDLIDPSAFQPRVNFDESKLDELAKSIIANGVVQPLLMRRRGGRFELIAGERRWRAAQRAGLLKVPAVIRNVSDEKVLELALIENIQREDLNPIEEARAYRKLIDTLGLTQEIVAERVGRDRSYITNYLRLLRLPDDLQDLLQAGKLSTGHARALLAAEHADVQRRVARRIIDQELSVRATERLLRQITGPRTMSAAPAHSGSVGDPNVRAVETKLTRQFGTKVRIVHDRDNKGGKIELEFYTQSDLNRLYMLLAGSPRV
jgi:ParB family chromosome partitioning protein